ncbi:nucleoside triphosphate pyrophosphohydrolase [uncultured Methylobacterium sp.]|uniref:nucleoside triphosphate pyrophosphohydrolase n=1 Tax=uncultured Methylobacterium sp. TaxID=157278 RepID=UPI0035CABE4A
MPEASFRTLARIMAELRDPERGCAWDAAQTFASIAPYTIEEAYEVADAIERGDLDDLREELGDLLLQVVFHARLAEEVGAFDLDDVAAAITAKLIRRHPHVFDAHGGLRADGGLRDPAAIAEQWEAIKAVERSRRPARAAGRDDSPARDDPLAGDESLAGIARALPALTRAEKIARRAAAHGFDWSDPVEVVAKVREETDEVAEALRAGDPAALTEEIGDLLFSVANLARHAGVDPEAALRAGNDKFVRRFAGMVARLRADGLTLVGSDLAAMEAAWAAVKRSERTVPEA